MYVNARRYICPYSQKLRIIILLLHAHTYPNFERRRQREGQAGATGYKENGPGRPAMKRRMGRMMMTRLGRGGR